MIKELKYLFFILFFSLFIFFTFKYYISNDNKKKSYREFKNNDKRVFAFSQKLKLLENDTENVVEYVEKTINKNKKKYNFWKLLNTDE